MIEVEDMQMESEVDEDDLDPRDLLENKRGESCASA